MGRPHPRLAASLAALATLLLVLAACSADGPVTFKVTVENFKYLPDPITISVGDSITWTNEDPVGHTSTATDDSFNTGMFFPDKSATLTFDAAGTFPYFCATHPEMVGTIVVEPAD
ncbi:hypothetical protein BH18ACT5_BH18ACT5_13520 [soil metagenome]